MPSRKPGTKATAISRGFSLHAHQPTRSLAICLCLTLLAAAPAGASTVSGTIKRPDGTPVTGTIEFVLSQSAKTTTPPVLFAPVRTTCAVTNGLIAAGCTVQGNDTLDPAGTYYTVRVVDSNNRVVVPAANYTIAGASVDLGTLPVTATATLVPPSGNVVGNLSVTGTLSVAGSATINGVDFGASHLRLLGLTADPATSTDGSIFHRSDLNRIRIHAQGLQLFDGVDYIDINSSQPNTVDIGGNLKVAGATQLGSSADLSCGSTDATTPSSGGSRLYCLTGDKRVYLKNDTGAILGPLAALNQPQTWTAAQIVAELNNIRYAVGSAGADAGAKIQACINALPPTGGTCDARGLEGAQTISTTITIPANKPIRLLLGAATFTYSANPAFQLSHGSHGFEIIGLGPNSTVFVSSGDAAFLKLGSTAVADNVRLENFRIVAGTAATKTIEVGSTAQAYADVNFRNGWLLRNLDIDGTSAATTGRTGVSLTQLAQWRIDHVWVHNFETAILFDRTTVGEASRLRVHNFKNGIEWRQGDAPGGSNDTAVMLDVLGPTNGTGGVGLKIGHEDVKLHGIFLEAQSGATSANLLHITASGAHATFDGITFSNAAATSLANLILVDNGFVSPKFVSPVVTIPGGKPITLGTPNSAILGSKAQVWGGTAEFHKLIAANPTSKYIYFGAGSYGAETDIDSHISNFKGIIRATEISVAAADAPAAGKGWETQYQTEGDQATTTVYDRTAGTFKHWEIKPLSLDIAPSGTSKLLVNAAGTTLDLVLFTETAGDQACAAGDFHIKANSTTNKLRGCENGTLFDVNSGGGSGYGTIQDEGTPLTQRTTLNFTGAGVSCADDTTKTTCNIGGGGGSGDAIEVEDGDNVGTFTAIDTTARFDDSGDINFTFTDGGAGGPDTITATVRADSVALGIDTTGNYVDDVTGGAGITVTHTPGEGSEPDVAIDLLTAEDNTGATSNNSGMEFGGVSSDKLALLQGCSDGQIIKWTNTGGTWGCANDNNSGGSTPWEALVNSADTATSYLSNNTAETVTFNFEAAFTAGSQFLIRQQTGNPTGAELVRFAAADADPTIFRVRRGTAAASAPFDMLVGDDVSSLSGTGQAYANAGLAALAYLNPTKQAPISAVLETNRTSPSAVGILSMVLQNNTSGTQSAVYAGEFDAYAAPTSPAVITRAAGVLGEVFSSGTGTVTDINGLIGYANPAHTGGTTTWATGGLFSVDVSGGAVVTDVSGARINSNSNSASTVTNNYGLLIANQAGVGTNNWAIKTEGTARSQFGGPVDTDTGFRVSNAATTGRCLRGDGTNFVASGSNCVLTDSTDTLTNKTLNVEATGNAITTVSKITLVAAGCNNATAGPGFDLPTSNAPAPACLGTSPHRLGSLDFADGSTQTAVSHFRLPGDWTGGVDVAFLFTGDTASSNNIRWQVSSACVADSEDLLNPSYNTASASNAAGPATAGQRKSVSFSSVSVSNCAAGETVFWKFERIGADAGDTYTGIARLLEVEITLRRTQ